MKKKYSVKWKASKQPRKQRKFRHNAPLHVKHKFMSANLSKTLREKHGRRSFVLRKGDNVKIMVGEFKGKSGKTDVIDKTRLRTSIEGINKTKKDGSKVAVWFNPSNLQIQELNLDDKKRLNALERTNKSKETDKKTFKKLPKTEKPTEKEESKKSKETSEKQTEKEQKSKEEDKDTDIKNKIKETKK